MKAMRFYLVLKHVSITDWIKCSQSTLSNIGLLFVVWRGKKLKYIIYFNHNTVSRFIEQFSLVLPSEGSQRNLKLMLFPYVTTGIVFFSRNCPS